VDIASSGVQASHPRVEFGRHGTLSIEAGTFPQYPFYFTSMLDNRCLLACSRLAPLSDILQHAPIDAVRMIGVMSWPSDGDSDLTIYSGIKRLRPCERLIASRQGMCIQREFPRIGGSYRRGKPADLANELRCRLETSIERAIENTTRVGVFVSGGLDSSGVLALASRRPRISQHSIRAFSIICKTPGDDRPFFEEMIRSTGVGAERLFARDAGYWLRSSMCIDAQPAPPSSTCMSILLASAAARWNADVVLTGAGGDRVCGGVLPYAQLARRGHVLRAACGALRVRTPWPMDSYRRLKSMVVSPLLPHWLLPSVWVPWRRHAPSGPAWLSHRSRAIVREIAGSLRARPLPDTPDAWLKELCSGYVLPSVADQSGQVASITGCAPVDVFLDEDLVRFIVELEPQALSFGDEYRGLYRHAMKNVLPEMVRTRQDKARFEPAIAAAVSSSGREEELRDLASLRELGARGLVEPAAFSSTFRDFLAVVAHGERSYELPMDAHVQQVWQILAAEAFLREHGRGREILWNT